MIGGRPPKEGGPERSVAWNDEDAITQGADPNARNEDGETPLTAAIEGGMGSP